MRASVRLGLATTAALAVSAGAAAVVFMIHDAPQKEADRTTIASVWQGYLAPAAIALTLLGLIYGWWQRGRQRTLDADPTRAAETLDRAADRLAQLTRKRWQEEAHAARLTSGAALVIRWVWNRKRSLPVEELFAPDAVPGPTGSTLTLYHEVWSRLLHRRLVILGEGGSGKSGALTLLLLAALEHRQKATSAEARSRIPVPVLVNLSGWQPDRRGLAEHVTLLLERDFPALLAFGRDVIPRLIAEDRLELLLDGFDEVPPNSRAAALNKIDSETVGLRLALASRPSEYLKASRNGQFAHPAVIDLTPLEPAAVAAYLAQGHTSPQARHRWERFVTELRAGSAVAKALHNPLTLVLARATYGGAGNEELQQLTSLTRVRDVRAAVVGAFLTTAYRRARHPGRDLYWLGWIARQPGTDHEIRWWEIPAWVPEDQFRRAARWALGVAGALCGAAMLAAVGRHRFRIILLGHDLGGLWTAVLLGACIGAVAGLLFHGRLRQQRSAVKRRPSILRVRWPGPRDLRRMVLAGVSIAAAAVPVTAAINAGAARVVSPHHYPGIGTGTAGVVGFGFGVLGWLVLLWSTPSTNLAATNPTATYRADFANTLVTALCLAALLGVAEVFSAMRRTPLSEATLRGISVGVISLLLIWISESSSAALFLTEMVLLVTSRRRVRFMRLLREASDRGILRQTGAGYRFHHAELREYLKNTTQERQDKERQDKEPQDKEPQDKERQGKERQGKGIPARPGSGRTDRSGDGSIPPQRKRVTARTRRR